MARAVEGGLSPEAVGVDAVDGRPGGHRARGVQVAVRRPGIEAEIGAKGEEAEAVWEMAREGSRPTRCPLIGTPPRWHASPSAPAGRSAGQACSGGRRRPRRSPGRAASGARLTTAGRTSRSTTSRPEPWPAAATIGATRSPSPATADARHAGRSTGGPHRREGCLAGVAARAVDGARRLAEGEGEVDLHRPGPLDPSCDIPSEPAWTQAAAGSSTRQYGVYRTRRRYCPRTAPRPRCCRRSGAAPRWWRPCRPGRPAAGSGSGWRRGSS